jgi:hypothetical protein
VGRAHCHQRLSAGRRLPTAAANVSSPSAGSAQRCSRSPARKQLYITLDRGAVRKGMLVCRPPHGEVPPELRGGPLAPVTPRPGRSAAPPRTAGPACATAWRRTRGGGPCHTVSALKHCDFEFEMVSKSGLGRERLAARAEHKGAFQRPGSSPARRARHRQVQHRHPPAPRRDAAARTGYPEPGRLERVGHPGNVANLCHRAAGGVARRDGGSGSRRQGRRRRCRRCPFAAGYCRLACRRLDTPLQPCLLRPALGRVRRRRRRVRPGAQPATGRTRPAWAGIQRHSRARTPPLGPPRRGQHRGRRACRAAASARTADLDRPAHAPAGPRPVQLTPSPVCLGRSGAPGLQLSRSRTQSTQAPRLVGPADATSASDLCSASPPARPACPSSYSPAVPATPLRPRVSGSR